MIFLGTVNIYCIRFLDVSRAIVFPFPLPPLPPPPPLPLIDAFILLHPLCAGWWVEEERDGVMHGVTSVSRMDMGNAVQFI